MQQHAHQACDFSHDDICLVGLVPDAESFGLLDVEEWGFNLWLVVVFPTCGREPATVDLWVQLLKLKQRTIKLKNEWLTDVCVGR